MSAVFGVLAVVLWLAVIVRQGKRRNEFIALLEQHAPEKVLSFKGRIGRNGLAGHFQTGNPQLDRTFKRFQDEVVLLRFLTIASFFAAILMPW